MSDGEPHRPGGIEGRHGRGLNVDSNEFGDSDETADADNLTGSDIGLVVCSARSDDCTTFGDCGADGGDDNDLNDGENVVGSGELDGSESGLSGCESGSKDRVRLGSCDG